MNCSPAPPKNFPSPHPLQMEQAGPVSINLNLPAEEISLSRPPAGPRHNRKMDLSTAANVVNAVAVLAGVIFAATQIRDYRHKRRRDSMLNLVQSFQNPTFVRGLRTVVEISEGATAEEIRRQLGPEGEDAVA